ncbi:MAG: hypothetical protein AB7U20_17815 [Planctomycetaceae bacterium]
MKSQDIRLSAMTICMLAVCVLPATAAAADAVPTMDEIIAAARQRQEAVSSGRFEWTAERWINKSARNIGRGRMTAAPMNPSEDFEATAERTLLFSGKYLRYESFGPDWNDARDADMPYRVIMTWDGQESRTFRDPEGFWHGMVESDGRFKGLRTFDPVAWTYRFFDPNWTYFDVREFSVRTSLEEVGGEPCVVLERSQQTRAMPQAPLVYRLWLSCGRQFIVRQYERLRGPTVHERVQIEYEDSAHGHAVPVSWTKIEGEDVNRELVSKVTKCDVVDYELNVPIASDSFDLEFPANTWVQEEGVEDPYIVREDGSHRVVTQAELRRGAKYEDVLATPSGQAIVLPLRSNPYMWIAWLVQALLAAGILCYLYRTRWAPRNS